MKITPFRLLAVSSVFSLGSLLGIGLFIFNLAQAKYAGAALVLGFAFSMMALAANPKSLFRNFRDPVEEISATDTPARRARILNLLMGFCYVGSLLIFVIDKFIH